MKAPIIRKLLNIFKDTPLHPQWFALRESKKALVDVSKHAHGRVLDIGCAQQFYKKAIPEDCDYIGLDYYKTAAEWYGTHPQVYGDAQQLPFATSSLNTVLLLDVLEHLPSPASCISEIKRILNETGTAVIQVPFIYPMHDTPLDFHRWTEHGLTQLFQEHDLEITEIKIIGKPIETAALLFCIAISKHVLNWLNQKSILSVAAVLLPFVFLTTNCSAWVVAALSRGDALMPAGYRCILRKTK